MASYVIPDGDDTVALRTMAESSCGPAGLTSLVVWHEHSVYDGGLTHEEIQ